MLNTIENKTPKVMIVSRAKNGLWETYYSKDPKTSPMPKTASAYFTLAGSAAKIKPFYTDIQEAEQDLKKIKLINPTGGYAICELDEASHEKPYLHYESKILEAA